MANFFPSLSLEFQLCFMLVIATHRFCLSLCEFINCFFFMVSGVLQHLGQLELSYVADGYKLVQSLWKTVWQYILKLNIHISYDPAFPLNSNRKWALVLPSTNMYFVAIASKTAQSKELSSPWSRLQFLQLKLIILSLAIGFYILSFNYRVLWYCSWFFHGRIAWLPNRIASSLRAGTTAYIPLLSSQSSFLPLSCLL